MEISLSLHGTRVDAAVRASETATAAGPMPLGADIDELERFSAAVRDGASRRVVMGRELIARAQRLFEALFVEPVRRVYDQMRGRAGADGKLLIRLVMAEPRLQAIPWEALCEPGTERFLGSAQGIVLARDFVPIGEDDWAPARSPIRALLVTPFGAPELLGPPAELVERLAPIVGDLASPRHVGQALRSCTSRPNLVHFVGHGGFADHGGPALWLSDGQGGQQGIPAETLARDLQTAFGELPCVLLDACRSGDSGPSFSAARSLLDHRVRAAVAYLWPVAAPTARQCAQEIYRLLTFIGPTRGDLGAALSDARVRLGGADGVGYAAESFAPVLYLRGKSSVVFDPPYLVDVDTKALGGRLAAQSKDDVTLVLYAAPWSRYSTDQATELEALARAQRGAVTILRVWLGEGNADELRRQDIRVFPRTVLHRGAEKERVWEGKATGAEILAALGRPA